MKSRFPTREIERLSGYLTGMPRSKKQLNRLNESDCEIVKQSPSLYLLANIDSVSDEWDYGLYKDPETMAWICVQGALSDLAAAGGTPTGFLFSPLWPIGDPSLKKTIFDGIRKALKAAKVPLLGGDEGEAKSLSLTGVALGSTTRKPLTRIGAKPGDLIGLIGNFGIGPALGFRFLMGRPEEELPEKCFRPVAQLKHAPTLLKYASASIDTSDGLFTALHTLSILNGVKVELDFSAVKIAPEALRFCMLNGIPPLTLGFGEIGDYQICFTFSKSKLKALKKAIPGVKIVGRILPDKENHLLKIDNRTYNFDPGLVTGLPKDNLESIRGVFEQTLSWIQNLKAIDVGTNSK